MPSSVKLLTYNKPSWVAIKQINGDFYPTLTLDLNTYNLNTFILVFDQPGPPTTRDFTFDIAL
jgi:hypothetical protein